MAGESSIANHAEVAPGKTPCTITCDGVFIDEGTGGKVKAFFGSSANQLTWSSQTTTTVVFDVPVGTYYPKFNVRFTQLGEEVTDTVDYFFHPLITDIVDSAGNQMTAVNMPAVGGTVLTVRGKGFGDVAFTSASAKYALDGGAANGNVFTSMTWVSDIAFTVVTVAGVGANNALADGGVLFTYGGNAKIPQWVAGTLLQINYKVPTFIDFGLSIDGGTSYHSSINIEKRQTTTFQLKGADFGPPGTTTQLQLNDVTCDTSTIVSDSVATCLFTTSEVPMNSNDAAGPLTFDLSVGSQNSIDSVFSVTFANVNTMTMVSSSPRDNSHATLANTLHEGDDLVFTVVINQFNKFGTNNVENIAVKMCPLGSANCGTLTDLTNDLFVSANVFESHADAVDGQGTVTRTYTLTISDDGGVTTAKARRHQVWRPNFWIVDNAESNPGFEGTAISGGAQLVYTVLDKIPMESTQNHLAVQNTDATSAATGVLSSISGQNFQAKIFAAFITASGTAGKLDAIGNCKVYFTINGVRISSDKSLTLDGSDWVTTTETILNNIPNYQRGVTAGVLRAVVVNTVSNWKASSNIQGGGASAWTFVTNAEPYTTGSDTYRITSSAAYGTISSKDIYSEGDDVDIIYSLTTTGDDVMCGGDGACSTNDASMKMLIYTNTDAVNFFEPDVVIDMTPSATKTVFTTPINSYGIRADTTNILVAFESTHSGSNVVIDPIMYKFPVRSSGAASWFPARPRANEPVIVRLDTNDARYNDQFATGSPKLVVFEGPNGLATGDKTGSLSSGILTWTFTNSEINDATDLHFGLKGKDGNNFCNEGPAITNFLSANCFGWTIPISAAVSAKIWDINVAVDLDTELVLGLVANTDRVTLKGEINFFPDDSESKYSSPSAQELLTIRAGPVAVFIMFGLPFGSEFGRAIDVGTSDSGTVAQFDVLSLTSSSTVSEDYISVADYWRTENTDFSQGTDAVMDPFGGKHTTVLLGPAGGILKQAAWVYDASAMDDTSSPAGIVRWETGSNGIDLDSLLNINDRDTNPAFTRTTSDDGLIHYSGNMYFSVVRPVKTAKLTWGPRGTNIQISTDASNWGTATGTNIGTLNTAENHPWAANGNDLQIGLHSIPPPGSPVPTSGGIVGGERLGLGEDVKIRMVSVDLRQRMAYDRDNLEETATRIQFINYDHSGGTKTYGSINMQMFDLVSGSSKRESFTSSGIVVTGVPSTQTDALSGAVTVAWTATPHDGGWNYGFGSVAYHTRCTFRFGATAGAATSLCMMSTGTETDIITQDEHRVVKIDFDSTNHAISTTVELQQKLTTTVVRHTPKKDADGLYYMELDAEFIYYDTESRASDGATSSFRYLRVPQSTITVTDGSHTSFAVTVTEYQQREYYASAGDRYVKQYIRYTTAHLDNTANGHPATNDLVTFVHFQGTFSGTFDVYDVTGAVDGDKNLDAGSDAFITEYISVINTYAIREGYGFAIVTIKAQTELHLYAAVSGIDGHSSEVQLAGKLDPDVVLYVAGRLVVPDPDAGSNKFRLNVRNMWVCASQDGETLTYDGISYLGCVNDQRNTHQLAWSTKVITRGRVAAGSEAQSAVDGIEASGDAVETFGTKVYCGGASNHVVGGSNWDDKADGCDPVETTTAGDKEYGNTGVSFNTQGVVDFDQLSNAAPNRKVFIHVQHTVTDERGNEGPVVNSFIQPNIKASSRNAHHRNAIGARDENGPDAITITEDPNEHLQPLSIFDSSGGAASGGSKSVTDTDTSTGVSVLGWIGIGSACAAVCAIFIFGMFYRKDNEGKTAYDHISNV